MIDGDREYSLRGAARAVGRGVEVVRAAVRRGELAVLRGGARPRVLGRDLAAWQEGRRGVWGDSELVSEDASALIARWRARL